LILPAGYGTVSAMGYYTAHTLSVIPVRLKSEIQSAFNERVKPAPFEGERCEWHDCVADTVEISKKYPNALIRIYGEGEEQGDQWVLYANDGSTVEIQREQWSMPPAPGELLEQHIQRCESRDRLLESAERAEYERLKEKFEGS